ncbi:MAG: methyltransferase domain-containing protein [Candidatus Bilamarchaeaceae archaeon]
MSSNLKNNKKNEEIMEKIEIIDENIKAITQDLPIKLGSILRIASQALKNWGIDIDLSEKELQQKLEIKSLEEYSKEWRVVNDAVYRAIHQAVIDSNLGEGNQQLNTEIGKIATPIIIEKLKNKKKLIMADIGAGTGETTATILSMAYDEIGKRGLSNIEVYLIEPSFRSTSHLVDIMQKSYPTVQYQIITATDYQHLQFLKKSVFDIVVSNAVFHHHSFPTYLRMINDIIKKDGFLIIGDWYSEIWYEPKTVAYLLKEGLGINEEKVCSFINLFEKASWPQIVQYWNNKKEDEKIRNEGMLLYIKNLVKRLKEEHERLEEERKKAIQQNLHYDANTKVELNIFEAHETYEHRKEKIIKAGFEVNPDDIRKKHKYIRTTEKQVVEKKFAMVTLAWKK